MKKIINLLCASMLLLVSCSENVVLEVNPVSEPFFASVEGTTRTYADENGKLLWTANDRITIFKGTTYPLVYQFTGSTGDNYGGFNEVTPSLGEFETSNELSANYAVYPYAANTSISNSGVINYTVPTTQTYAENSFGLGANVMVAVTENTEDKHLSFKNVGGYFEFSLYGEGVTVRSIVFSGNNNEKLAGNATISATHNGTPVIAFADDATTTLTLNCGGGVELGADAEHATKFWFVVPSITYENGITITITDTEGKVMEKTTNNEITIERSTVQPLAAFKVETYSPIPTNQIWYTSTDGNVVTLYKTDVFGANIVSNVYENGKGVITFDGNVTSIDNNAFYDCTSLESITLPSSVTTIGNYAFEFCYSLTSITIPEGVQTIGNNAFYHCRSLENITLPEGIQSIGNYAFWGCSSLESITIPKGVTSVGHDMFGFCSSLASITIPDSVQSIGNFAFSDCSSLESITLPEGVLSIGEYAFNDCSSLESITLPSSVTTIGEKAFGSCTSLTSITIPSGVTSIEFNTFYNCSSLESITLPSSVTTIGENAFESCTSLTSIIIPNSVTAIGENAFGSCTSLTSITIPSGVTSITNNTFYNCTSLTSITIPEGVTSIGTQAFDNCASLKSITLPNSVTLVGLLPFINCSSLESFEGKYASLDKRCLIVDGELISFAPAGLTSYAIPSGVTSIGVGAFAYCRSLMRITISSGVTSIRTSAFSRCSSLVTVYSTPTTPPTLGSNVFENTSLSKIYVPTLSVNAYKSASGWSNYASKIEGTTF